MKSPFSKNVIQLDTNPLYGEIEFRFLQFDDCSDPLNISEESEIPNWHEIKNNCEILLEIGTDFYVALWRMRANLRIEGFSEFYYTITSINEILNEVNENNDLCEEANEYIATSLGFLATNECIFDLRNSFFTKESSLLISQLLDSKEKDLIPEAELSDSEIAVSLEKIDSSFSEKEMPILQMQFVMTIEALKKIEETINQLSEGYQLSCDRLIEFIERISIKYHKLADHYIPKSVSTTESSDVSTNVSSIFSAKSIDVIESRNDVILALDQILDYFSHHEPSHPAPLLLERVKKMMGMNFENIIEELLPDSLGQLQFFSGKKA